MTFFYTDYGNHEAWISALQGGSFCRVHKLHRFFYGSDTLYPAMGSDNFRLDSQIAINTTGDLGTLIQVFAPVGVSEEASSPVGIVEDENTEHGRYFTLKYVEEGLTFLPIKLQVYDSSYSNELDAPLLVDSWTPAISLLQGVEQGMRVVNLGGDEPAANRTFLYYLESTGVSTNIYFVRLPDEGVSASVAAPILVAEVDILTRNRFYVVHVRDDLVALYIGDNDRAQSRRTAVLLHDPIVGSLVQGPETIVADSVPFPQSYAACQGQDGDIHMILEPPISWREGWATYATDLPDTGNEVVPPRHKSTGNTWSLYSLIEDGRVVDDQLIFNAKDVQTWMGATGGDSMGGFHRTSVIPWMMTRQSAPPAKFQEDFNSVPAFDTSASYALTAAVGTRQPDTDEALTFAQRADGSGTNFRPVYGNHRGSTNWENEESQPLIGSFPERRQHNLLVPGTFLIESLRDKEPGTFSSLTTLDTQAVRLDSWGLDDNSHVNGEPASSLEAPTPVDQQSPVHNPSTDCVHGVQAGLFDAELGFVVGWFTNGVPE